MTVKNITTERMNQLRGLASGGDTMAQYLVALFDTDISTMVQVLAPAAKGTNNIAVALAANAPGNFVIGASPDKPRNLRVIMAASWDGGDVTVVGTDQFGQPVSEVFATGSGVTRVGTKIFKTVTSATKAAVGATANTATIGTGDKLGLPVRATQDFGMVGDSTPTAMAPVAIDKTYHGFTPPVVPDGVLNYTVQISI